MAIENLIIRSCIGFVTQMNTQIYSFLREHEFDNQTLWEQFKVKMKELPISYSKGERAENQTGALVQ